MKCKNCGDIIDFDKEWGWVDRQHMVHVRSMLAKKGTFVGRLPSMCPITRDNHAPDEADIVQQILKRYD